MFRGFYTASTGMIAQQRRTEMLSNNIANANTPGFKAEQSTIRSFPDLLMSRIEQKGSPSLQNGFAPGGAQTIGSVNNGVYMQETLPNFAQGSIVESGNATDIALTEGNMPIDEETGKPGTIFFKLQAKDGDEAYTRNGNFIVDGEGYLVTPQGNYVLDQQNNKIALPSENFTISKEGNITVDGRAAGKLGVAFSAQPDTLVKRDNGLFYTIDNEPLQDAYANNQVSFTLEQGFTESSNVDSSQSMTAMMEAYRVFEANQKVLQAYDRSMDKAVNEIGRV